MRPPYLYIGCGREVLIYSVGAGGWQLAQRVAPASGAPVTAVTGSLDGRTLFFGTGGSGPVCWAGETAWVASFYAG